MKRFRLFLLIAIALIFGASSLYSYNRDLEVVSYVSSTIKSIGWESSELEIELLKFDQALTGLAASMVEEDEVELHFELLWSRIDSLLLGEVSRPMREQPGVLALLREFKAQLEQWEERVYALSSDDVATIKALRQELSEYRTLVREVNVDTFSGESVWRQLDMIQDIRLRSNLYLAGLMLSGLAMLILLVRENRRNWRLAYHDVLTGLHNRMSFYHLIASDLGQAARERSQLAVYMIDLNGFKAVNDSLGHEVGDRLLQEVASRLRDTIGRQGVAARLGGDEFVVLQRLKPDEGPEQMAALLWQSLSREVKLPDGNLSPHACIGISLYPDHGTTKKELLSHADTAMYHAKQSSDSSVQLFEFGLNEPRVRRQKLALALEAAIEHDHLELHYQPIFDLRSETVESVEALLRWNSSEFGAISPLEIIDVAEKHGLAQRLNRWVLLKACRQLKRWKLSERDGLKVNVNISPSIFKDGELVATIREALDSASLAASSLVLEITEDTSLWDTAGSLDRVKELRQLGVEIALDDFGTGYSSFSHLRQLPFNKLKLDKSFIDDLASDTRAVSLIRTIISLAKSLDMVVTAEGIEASEQMEQLNRLGCHLGQGYLLAKPMPVDVMEQVLLKRTTSMHGET
ncbi:EAL domain-containing protein [Halomonas sp. YLGW01]|uniref:putative bifunctional diguanylate cyclase/phosphodiesterase n=1 Tax=Halomonas sp. YLGW01 TaxID=2773308 RepID=UPI001780DD0E|nr:EAL domain-containing protein [Halomonas sp. YLGW01]